MTDDSGTESGTPTERREYRMEELARLAGITVRTLRFYRERKLIPPPRREGRVAWYDDQHLARLRTITALLERGHTLNGIAELAEAFDNGRGVGDLLGMEVPTEETPVRLTPEELADHFAGEVTPENLAAALDLGYLGVDGEEIVHISRRLLEVSSALVREGIPLGEVLRTAAPAGPQRGGRGAVAGAGPETAETRQPHVIASPHRGTFRGVADGRQFTLRQ